MANSADSIMLYLCMFRQFVIGQCTAVNRTESLISDLSKFTGYAFRVVVVNEAGPGPAAYAGQMTMEDCMRTITWQIVSDDFLQIPNKLRHK